MFDLEQSITNWRQQMLAAGIKTPVPLEELETHLREDVEQQMNSGLDALPAFEAAVKRIGQAIELKSEFQKANPNERMKKNLISFLAIIATLAIGMGLILPAIANWRAHETLPTAGVALLLIGVAIFAFGSVCAAIGIFKSLRRRPKT